MDKIDNSEPVGVRPEITSPESLFNKTWQKGREKYGNIHLDNPSREALGEKGGYIPTPQPEAEVLNALAKASEVETTNPEYAKEIREGVGQAIQANPDKSYNQVEFKIPEPEVKPQAVAETATAEIPKVAEVSPRSPQKETRPAVGVFQRLTSILGGLRR